MGKGFLNANVIKLSHTDIMRLFIDSSDINVWKRHARAGWVYGATTNPLIFKKDGNECSISSYEKLVDAARDIGFRELQIQTTGQSADELFENGEAISQLTGHIDMVVKVPFTRAGMEAGSRLIQNGHRVTMTAAYAVHQMIAASAMKAAYIAPYYGRLMENGKDGDAILTAMVGIGKTSPKAPRILVASIRTIGQLENLCGFGLNTFTLSQQVAEDFGQCSMSDLAAVDFEAARTK